VEDAAAVQQVMTGGVLHTVAELLAPFQAVAPEPPPSTVLAAVPPHPANAVLARQPTDLPRQIIRVASLLASAAPSTCHLSRPACHPRLPDIRYVSERHGEWAPCPAMATSQNVRSGVEIPPPFVK